MHVVAHVVEFVAHSILAKVKRLVQLLLRAGHLAKMPVGAAKPFLVQEHARPVVNTAGVARNITARGILGEQDFRMNHRMLRRHQP